MCWNDATIDSVINQPGSEFSTHQTTLTCHLMDILSVHTSMHSWISSLCLACTLIIISFNPAFSCIHFCLAYQAKMSLTLHKSEVDERQSRLFLVQPLSTIVHSCSLCVASFPGLPRFYLPFAFRRECVVRIHVGHRMFGLSSFFFLLPPPSLPPSLPPSQTLRCPQTRMTICLTRTLRTDGVKMVKKLLSQAAHMPVLSAPDDRSITSQYVSGVDTSITEEDLRFS